LFPKTASGILADARDGDAFGTDFGGSADEAELRAQVFQHLDRPEGLREMLSLNRIIVQRREKDDFAYLTFDFACSWDQEQWDLCGDAQESCR
jgi:hypothetical protein